MTVGAFRSPTPLILEKEPQHLRVELRPKPFTKRVAAERLALIFGIVAFPVLAVALGIRIAMLANALR